MASRIDLISGQKNIWLVGTVINRRTAELIAPGGPELIATQSFRVSGREEFCDGAV